MNSKQVELFKLISALTESGRINQKFGSNVVINYCYSDKQCSDLELEDVMKFIKKLFKSGIKSQKKSKSLIGVDFVTREERLSSTNKRLRAANTRVIKNR